MAACVAFAFAWHPCSARRRLLGLETRRLVRQVDAAFVFAALDPERFMVWWPGKAQDPDGADVVATHMAEYFLITVDAERSLSTLREASPSRCRGRRPHVDILCFSCDFFVAAPPLHKCPHAGARERARPRARAKRRAWGHSSWGGMGSRWRSRRSQSGRSCKAAAAVKLEVHWQRQRRWRRTTSRPRQRRRPNQSVACVMAELRHPQLQWHWPVANQPLRACRQQGRGDRTFTLRISTIARAPCRIVAQATAWSKARSKSRLDINVAL